MARRTLTDQDLSIEVDDEGPQVVLVWRGRSTAREPRRFLVPILTSALEVAVERKVELVLDFTQIEFFNSSTVTPVIRLLEDARRKSARVVVRYRKDLQWQALSFTALQTLMTSTDLIRIEGA